MIPYSRQYINNDDVLAVSRALQDDYLTTGPRVEEFEAAVAKEVGARYAVAVSSGTAALHTAYAAAKLGGSKVIIPPMTFVATASMLRAVGAEVLFCDVRREDLNIDPIHLQTMLGHKPKAVVCVDYGGKPCYYDELRSLSRKYEFMLIADACHSFGGHYMGYPVGSGMLADITVFSFHPVKSITTGEGGMLVTDSKEIADAARLFRNHGITKTWKERTEQGAWEYDIQETGFNYRLTDFQCALGLSQLKRLPEFIQRRRAIAAKYNQAFLGLSPDIRMVTPGLSMPESSCHLYVVRVKHRDQIFAEMRNAGIGVNVHYKPVNKLTTFSQSDPSIEETTYESDEAYREILSLPIHPQLTDAEANKVITTLRTLVQKHS